MATLARLIAVVGVTALLALTVLGRDMPHAHAIYEDSDFDGAIDIGEEIAGSDPNDPTSIPETVGTELLAGYAACSNGYDDDLDGLVDDADPGCIDSDGDRVADPGEAYYGSDPNDASSFPESSQLDAILNYYGLPVVFCGDGVDNDRDGLTDVADPGCVPVANDGDGFDDYTEKRWGSDPGDPDSVPEHEVPNRGSCSDGVDNDLDGLTDAADPACQSPDNDDRADAVVIGALPFHDGPRVMKNATLEPNERMPTCVFGGLGGTVWYSYTATEDGVLIADTVGSTFTSSIAVWTGPSARNEVACNLTYSFPHGSRVVFQATAGTTYFFQIDGFPYDSPFPEVAFNLQTGVPPANDNFADATVVTDLPFDDSVNVSAAVVEFGEPASGCSGEANSTVWYAFTPDDDMLLLANAVGREGLVAVVSVWTDSVFGLAEVACRYPYGYPGASELAVDVRAGTTYYIQVGRYPYGDLTSFDLDFHLEQGFSPANDDLADATDVGPLPYSAMPGLVTATVEDGEPGPVCLPYDEVQASVWYRYTAASDTIVRAETAGGDPYGVVLGVYEGSSFDDLASAACATPYYPGPRTAFEVDAGETYLIQVARLSSGIFFPGPIPIGGTGGFAPTPPPIDSEITFLLSELGYPDCPSEQFSVPDPAGDAFNSIFFPQGDVRHDIVSVSGGSDSDLTCFTVEFREPVAPPGTSGERGAALVLDIDTDADPITGYGASVDYSCPAASGLGVETQMYMEEGLGLLVPFYEYFVEPVPIPLGLVPPPYEQPYALAVFGERSITITVGNQYVGGDDDFSFALFVRNANYRTTDCAPNGGHIKTLQPAVSGDVNCDGRANSLDATMIMQLFAGLTNTLPCQYLGDVNSNGGVGPLDALLILQYDAGLLDELPPVANNAVLAAVRATAQELSVFPGMVHLESKEAVEWPNSCLGLPAPGEACAEVITPGYRIELAVDDGFAQWSYTWHTNTHGSELRLARSSCGPCPPVP